jgi:hypothetical protein
MQDCIQPRHKFTSEEDQRLLVLVNQLSPKNWDNIAHQMGNRTARQCRDRYNNYLIDPSPHTPWAPQEDALIIDSYRRLGPKWVQIAKLLHGRNGIHVKNRWYRHLSKINRTREPNEDVELPREIPVEKVEEQEKEWDWEQVLPPIRKKNADLAEMFSNWDF